MDFWSRLIGSDASVTSSKKQSAANSPQQQLANFKHSYLKLQQVWQKTGPRSLNISTVQSVCTHLQNLNQILQDEARSVGPHTCMQLVATWQIYILVTLIASVGFNQQIQREAVRFFSLLIDSEEVDFIEDGAFADRLVSFVRVGLSSESVTKETESGMAELLFAVAARLRQRRAVPSAWYRANGGTNQKSLPSSGTAATKSKEFPLMFLLLEYVHYDGKIGDFARTGLLYILELAAGSDAFEKWIIESELATMMASGLGALYSQLSSKVTLLHGKESLPPVLAGCGMTDLDRPTDAEPIFSPTLQANLALFISYLVFWQDVLEQCPSEDIKLTLLDHLNFLFIRPLLYPSLVESSDNDSGSSVAVMTYLKSILENITHTDIIRLILTYMLGAPAQTVNNSKASRPTTLAQRRKSETLMRNNAIRTDDPSPEILTLTNILRGYLESRNHQTVTASLRLLATMLHSWHNIAKMMLMNVQAIPYQSHRKRSLSEHDQQLESLYCLAEAIVDDDALEGHFESHLMDAQMILETHPCSADHLLPPDLHDLKSTASRKQVQQRSILLDDSLLQSLLSLLHNFLTNDIAVNLSLSESLAVLASCRETVLEGWLLTSTQPSPQSASKNNGHEQEEQDGSNAQASGNSWSPVFVVLESLVESINQLREKIKDFDIHLAERRHVFMVGGEIDDAHADIPNPKTIESDDGNKSVSKHQVHIAPISGRLKVSGAPSRSISPRGRKEENRSDHPTQPKSLVGRLSHLRQSPSPNRSNPLERTYSPSPLRKQSLSSRASSPIPSSRRLSDVLQQKVRLQIKSMHSRHPRESGDSETSSMRSESFMSEARSGEETREVTLSHLLTNVIILQEFILELAAIIQVRASLYNEVTLQ